MKYIILAYSNNPGFEIPRQLTKINGERLVERTIRLLKENGVNDILITAKDKRFDGLGATRYEPIVHSYDYATQKGYWLDAFPFELMDEPVCFIWGDVYFSENAIKTIVETETNSTLFFCAFENHNPRYIKKWDEPLAYKVVDTELFKEKIIETKKMQDEKVTWRMPVVWELYRVIHGQCVNEHKMTTDYIAINDESCDIDCPNDIKLLEKVLGGDYMVKVEVIEEFTLGRFDELKNIQRKSREEAGRLFVGDIFECDIDMFEYLTKTNALGKAFVKIVEIIPEKEEFENAKEVVIELKEDKKNTATKKATKSKKTIAKK